MLVWLDYVAGEHVLKYATVRYPAIEQGLTTVDLDSMAGFWKHVDRGGGPGNLVLGQYSLLFSVSIFCLDIDILFPKWQFAAPLSHQNRVL